jgi:hypothetical protein
LRSRVSDWNYSTADGRQVEDRSMFELMNQQALAVGAGRRREVAVETMREARLSSGAARHAVGLALVGVGQWVAGEMPAAQVATQPDADCG